MVICQITLMYQMPDITQQNRYLLVSLFERYAGHYSKQIHRLTFKLKRRLHANGYT